MFDLNDYDKYSRAVDKNVRPWMIICIILILVLSISICMNVYLLKSSKDITIVQDFVSTDNSGVIGNR